MSLRPKCFESQNSEKLENVSELQNVSEVQMSQKSKCLRSPNASEVQMSQKSKCLRGSNVKKSHWNLKVSQSYKMSQKSVYCWNQNVFAVMSQKAKHPKLKCLRIKRPIVLQLSCTSDNLPPEGCTQYHFGSTTGSIKSFNFDGNLHLAQQNQNICIRYVLINNM